MHAEYPVHDTRFALKMPSKFIRILRTIASAFMFIAALEHAILHWSVRKQPQRIEFEIKCSWLFVKHTKVLSTATNNTKPSGEYTHPIP